MQQWWPSILTEDVWLPQPLIWTNYLLSFFHLRHHELSQCEPNYMLKSDLCYPSNNTVSHLFSNHDHKCNIMVKVFTCPAVRGTPNSNILTLQLCNSCNTLWFLRLCAIICLKGRTELQHPLITQYMLHIVYPYHVVPLSISVPCYCHPIPSPSCFTYYFQYFLYFIFSPYLSSVIRCWLLCTLFLM